MDHYTRLLPPHYCNKVNSNRCSHRFSQDLPSERAISLKMQELESVVPFNNERTRLMADIGQLRVRNFSTFILISQFYF